MCELMFLNVPGNICCMSESGREAARRAVAFQMQSKSLSRAALAAEAKVDPKTLRSFLDGERWPQSKTRADISVAIGWLPDEIDYIARNGRRRVGAEFHPAFRSRRPDASLRYASDLATTLMFLLDVAEAEPRLEDEGRRLVREVNAYWRTFCEYLLEEESHELSAVPDEVGDLIAADEQETSISGEQGEPEDA
jgi:hypothetical protein